MAVLIRIENQIAIAVLEGYIDGKTAPEFEKELKAIPDSAKQVILNLSKVGYVSSAGLRLLLLIYRLIKTRGGRVCLVGVHEDVREVMDNTGFLPYFLLADTEAEGLELLKPPQGAM